MKQADKNDLFKALLGESARHTTDPEVLKTFEEMALCDLDRVVPVVDRMMLKREDDLRVVMVCGHATLFLQLAPYAQQPKIAVDGKEGFSVVDAKRLKYECSQCVREAKIRQLVVDVKREIREMLSAEEMVSAGLCNAAIELGKLFAIQETTDGSTDSRVARTGDDDHPGVGIRHTDA